MSIKVDSLLNYESVILPLKCDLVHTKISINNIEKIINNILDRQKYTDVLKYYINITENYWAVSFKVDMSQFQEMCDSMFCIYLYKTIDDNCILAISNEIQEFPQWSDVQKDLFLLSKM